uniref:Uncharacterized protein n=1 Tax=Onchocerca volvulus TaxID=6282 RepID=A0A8R1XZC5_ONCVO
MRFSGTIISVAASFNQICWTEHFNGVNNWSLAMFVLLFSLWMISYNNSTERNAYDCGHTWKDNTSNAFCHSERPVPVGFNHPTHQLNFKVVVENSSSNILFRHPKNSMFGNRFKRKIESNQYGLAIAIITSYANEIIFQLLITNSACMHLPIPLFRNNSSVKMHDTKKLCESGNRVARHLRWMDMYVTHTDVHVHTYRSRRTDAQRTIDGETPVSCPLSRRVTDRIYKRVGLQLNDDSFSGGTLPKKNVHLFRGVIVEIDSEPVAGPFVKLCTSAKVLLRLRDNTLVRYNAQHIGFFPIHPVSFRPQLTSMPVQAFSLSLITNLWRKKKKHTEEKISERTTV